MLRVGCEPTKGCLGKSGTYEATIIGLGRRSIVLMTLRLKGFRGSLVTASATSNIWLTVDVAVGGR